MTCISDRNKLTKKTEKRIEKIKEGGFVLTGVPILVNKKDIQNINKVVVPFPIVIKKTNIQKNMNTARVLLLSVLMQKQEKIYLF